MDLKQLAALARTAAVLSPADLSFAVAASASLAGTRSETAQKTNALIASLLPVDDQADFASVTDAVDALLDQADAILDPLIHPSKNSKKQHTPTAATINTKTLEKPQLKFKDKIDNSPAPFIPKVPADALPQSILSHISSIAHSPAHPFESQIKSIEYPQSLFVVSEEVDPKPFDDDHFTWIDSFEQLQTLAETLSSALEFAVDLEHHSYRSFQGFTCLMQISTRSHDYVIDTIALRHHMHVLAPAFADPHIVKVLHGAESDIIWLQRDFSIYIVGLFDTYHASHVLQLQAHGLAFLLKTYCNVTTDKRFQLADWRIRPLPQDMLEYARSDTHYLLYIFDRMRNDILANSNQDTLNLMHVCLDRSAQTSLKTYQKEPYDIQGTSPSGWHSVLSKLGPLPPQQTAVFRAIHAWRDHIAREEDESTRYVAPDYLLYTIAKASPTTTKALFASSMSTPALVRAYAADLVALIKNTIDQHAQATAAANAQLASHREKIVASDMEFNKRVTEGPLHIRFDESAPDLPSNSREQSSSDASKITFEAAINTSDSTIKPSAHAQYWANRVPTSSQLVQPAETSSIMHFDIFIDGFQPDKRDAAASKADQIRAQLTFQAPLFVPDSSQQDRHEPSGSKPAAAPPNTSEAKPSPFLADAKPSLPEKIDTNQPSSSHDNPSPPKASKKAKITDGASVSTAIDLDSDSIVAVARHSKKQKKRNASATTKPTEFKPFSYDNPIVLGDQSSPEKSDNTDLVMIDAKEFKSNLPIAPKPQVRSKYGARSQTFTNLPRKS